MKRSEMKNLVKTIVYENSNLSEEVSLLIANQILSEQERTGSFLLEDGPKHEVCFNCCKVVVNNKCCSQPERREYDHRIKVGSRVKLSQKSIDEYHGTYTAFEIYTSSTTPESESFVNYVDRVISFTDGTCSGVVTGYGACDGIVKVCYTSKLTGKEVGEFYGLDELDFVEEDKE